MPKYNVTIVETLKKTVEVEAESPEEANQLVTDEWYSGEHILDADCFDGVEFESKEVHPKRIKVVLLEPFKLARIAEIDASLESMQQIVGGNIEPGEYFEEPVCIIQNREGKMLGLPLNRAVYGDGRKMIDIIAGTAFICSCSGEEFSSLSDEQLKKYCDKFKYPEKFVKIGEEIKSITIRQSKDFSR